METAERLDIADKVIVRSVEPVAAKWGHTWGADVTLERLHGGVEIISLKVRLGEKDAEKIRVGSVLTIKLEQVH